ncbi:MAG: ATP-binding protein [Opitutales bacterium]
MGAKKLTSLDKVLGRLDNLDAVNLTILVQRLARERGLLETIFNTLRDGILVINRQGVIEYVNEAAEKMVGVKEKDLGEVTLWKLVPDLSKTIETNLEELYPRLPLLLREIELTYPEHRFVRLYIVPFKEGGEQGSDFSRFVVILNDITQEKVTTEERIEYERGSSIFLLAAGVAHELGNPLNSLTIHLQLIKRHLKHLDPSREADKIRKSVEVCQTEVNRLDGIINNFLGAIRHSPPDFQDINLLDVLEEVLRFQATELENRGIEVDVELKEDLPIILGDRNQLKQVFFNLVNNAMHAMEAGGRLRVKAHSDDDFVRMQIGDSGAGISKENLSKVFQAYYTTKKEGHGLGLMIVQRIMREHGGQIGIESKEGRGTIIFLQFPQKHRRVRLLSG